jgi:hypothetical protein
VSDTTAADLADMLCTVDGTRNEDHGVFVNASLGVSPDDAHATMIITLDDENTEKQAAAFRVSVERTMPMAELVTTKPSLRCPVCNSTLRICGEQDTDPAWHIIECTNLQCTAQWDSAGEVGS